MTPDASPGTPLYRHLLVGGGLVVCLVVALTLAASGSAAAATTVTTCTEINATTAPADGHVVLGGDITDSGADPCLRINASDIVLNGAGHVVDGTGSGTAVAIEPDSGRLSNVTVRNLVTTDWRESITATRTDTVTIEAVRTSPDRTGIQVDDGTGILVRDSTVTEGTTTLEFTGVTDALVENTTITGFRDRGFDTSGSTNVSVIGSTFRDTQDGSQALRLTADGGQVLNNTISNLTDPTGGSGISVQGDGVEIRNNTIVDVTGGGLGVFNNEGNTVADNVLRRAGNGLYVGGQSQLVTNNSITDSQRGLSLGEGSSARPVGVRNVVRQNTMTNNTENFDPSVFDPADVDETNLVEGKPIHYVSDTIGVSVNGSQPVGYVYAYGVDGLVVRDLTLENASVTVSKSANISIQNVTAAGDGEGIYLLDPMHAALSDLDVDGWEFGLRLESDDGASNVTVRNSTITTTENDAYGFKRSALERALYGNAISGLTVRNTTVVPGDSNVGMDLTGTENVTVSGNDVGATDVGIRVGGGTTNAEISANAVSADTAIDADGNHVTISDNAVGGNGQSIAVGGGDSVVVTGNNASGNSRTGISLSNVFGDSRVQNNSIEANGDHGLTVRARAVEIRNNTIRTNGLHGISLSYDIDPGLNHVVDNNVTDNGAVGILIGSAGDTLENNRIERNQFGVHVLTDYGSSIEGGNVTMRDNALVDNQQGLYVDSVTNSDYLVALDNDIDRSNTIDGRPIVYHYNDTDVHVTGTDDPGYVGLVTVENASVTGVAMAAAGQGVFVQNSSAISIADSHIADTYAPLHIGLQSAGVSVQNLTATRESPAITYDPPTQGDLQGTGIAIERTEDVELRNVSVTGSRMGVLLDRDVNTTITDSRVSNSLDVGIGFTYGGEGLHFSNNLLNNSVQTNYPFSGFGYTLEVNVSRQPGLNIIGGPEIGGNAYFSPDGSGFSQTCTDADADGFCDSTYGLGGTGATDYLPLAVWTTGEPAITVIPSSVDFGPVPVRTTVSQNVTVTNAGNATLELQSTTLSGPDSGAFDIVSSGPSSLAPNASGTITVGFDPQSAGEQTASLDITSNDPANGSIAVDLSGNGTATASNGTLTGTVRNTTGTAMAGTTVAIQDGGVTVAMLTTDTNGQYTAQLPGGVTYTIQAVRSGYYINTTQAAVTNGSTTAQAIVLQPDTVDPTAVLNASAGTLAVGDVLSVDGTGSTDDLGIDQYMWDFGDGTTANGSTANHSYAGTGTYPVALTVADAAGNTNTTVQSVTVTGGPVIDVAPTSLAFGSVPVGSDTNATVTITNQGQQPLGVTGGAISGPAAGAFTASVGSSVLPVGASQNVTVTFTPGSSGAQSATLEVTSNDTTTPTVTVALAGTGQSSGGGLYGGGSGSRVSTTPPDPVVNVTRAGDRILVSVDHARAGGPINVSLDPAFGLGLSWLNVTPNVSGAFTLSIAASETQPTNTTLVLGDNETAIGYFTIEHSIPDADIDGVQFAVAVNNSILTAAGIDPATLTLSRMVNGTPVALPTHLVNETATQYRYEADSPGLSVFVVWGQVLETETPAPAPAPEPEPDPDPPAEPEPDPGPEDDPADDDIGGFGIAVAALGLLVAALLAGRFDRS